MSKDKAVNLKKDNIIIKIKNYIRETQFEVKKVIWPDRRYLTVATIIILIIVTMSAVLLIGMDFSLGTVIKYLTDSFGHTLR